jgi:hypothetical protein
MSDIKLHRLDPPNCGCTDCILRDWSIPVDTADNDQIMLMLAGKLDNATCYHLSDFLVIKNGDGDVLAVIMPWQRDAFDASLNDVAAVTLA